MLRRNLLFRTTPSTTNNKTKLKLHDISSRHRRSASSSPTMSSRPSMERAALISLDHRRPQDPEMSLGLGSIVAALVSEAPKINTERWQAFSFNVNHKNITIDQIVTNVISKVDPKNFDTIFFGAFVWNEPYVQRLLELFDEQGLCCIVGGPQVTHANASLLPSLYPHARGFIRGFAERAVCDLLIDPKRASPAGFFWRTQNPKFGIAPSDLASLAHASPFLPLDNNSDISRKPAIEISEAGFLRLETARGCPYACSFCQHREPTIPSSSDDGSTKKTGVSRYLGSLDRTRAEFDFFKKSSSLGAEGKSPKRIAIVDPTFNIDNAHACSVLSMLPKDCSVSLQTRPERLTESFLQAVADSPANVTLEFGIQSIIPTELAIIDRISTLAKDQHSKVLSSEKLMKKIERKIAMIDDNPVFREKVKYEFSLIFGLPFQTVESLQRSIDWCLKRNATRVVAFPLMLLRGTPLFDKRNELQLREGEISHLDLKIPRVQDFIPHVIETPSMTTGDFCRMAEIAAALPSSKNNQEYDF